MIIDRFFALFVVMNVPRRSFLKTSVSASVLAATQLGGAPTIASVNREYYELRAYRLNAGTGLRLKAGADPSLLDGYLERALLPALDRLGVKNVGVFTEIEVNKAAGTSTPKKDTPIWMLIPHTTLDSFAHVGAALPADPAHEREGAAYVHVAKASPAFERIDSWLLVAFAGQPRLELPAFSRARTPSRVFEMRDYESHSEERALNKIAMFDDGEIAVMRDLGMSPVFYGQALAGPDLPHLRYMTGAVDLATHLGNWKKFGPDPRWNRMKNLPQYTDNTSKNTARFLVPKPYSHI